MHITSFLRGGSVALACILSAAGWAGTSKLCTSSNAAVILDGPAAGSHRLVNSSADYSAFACFISPGVPGCRYTTLTLKSGTFDGGGWVSGPTTLAVGVPLSSGGPAQVVASQSLKKRGEVHVGAISGYGCQGLRFFVQSAPVVSSARALSAPGMFGNLAYFVAGADVVLEATGTVDPDYSTDGFAHFAWDLGEGQTAAGDVVTARFPKAGEYLPAVVVSDGKFSSGARPVPLWIRGPAQAPDTIASFRDCEVASVDVYWERTGTRFELELYDGTAWVPRYDGVDPFVALPGTVQGKTVRVRAWDAEFGAEPSGWVTHAVPRMPCPVGDPDL